MSKKKEDPKAAPVEATPPEELSGNGVFIYPSNLAKYEGDWIKEGGVKKRHGTGTFTEGQYVYTGEWKNDKFDGKGKFTFASGATYEGDFVEGKFEGNGRYVWADGTSYDGAWRSNRMHGAGKYVNKDNETFNGEFYNSYGPGLKLYDLQ